MKKSPINVISFDVRFEISHRQKWVSRVTIDVVYIVNMSYIYRGVENSVKNYKLIINNNDFILIDDPNNLRQPLKNHVNAYIKKQMLDLFNDPESNVSMFLNSDECKEKLKKHISSAYDIRLANFSEKIKKINEAICSLNQSYYNENNFTVTKSSISIDKEAYNKLFGYSYI
jgi:hypothetical protein